MGAVGADEADDVLLHSYVYKFCLQRLTSLLKDESEVLVKARISDMPSQSDERPVCHPAFLSKLSLIRHQPLSWSFEQ